MTDISAANVFFVLCALGQDNSSVIQAIRRGSSPSATKLEAICDALGLEFYIGEKRQEPISADALADDEFVKVSRYLIDLSAGVGQANDNAEMVAPMAFRADWMMQHGLKADDCVVVSVSGNSMEPTLFDGDLVLVDRSASQQPIRNLAIYAFSERNGEAKVKRFEQLADRLLIRSDNIQFTTEERRAEDANGITIIGRVVWSGHNI